MINLLFKKIRSLPGGELLDFVSPKFFDVIGAGDALAFLRRAASEILSRKTPSAFAEIQGLLEARNFTVKLGRNEAARSPINKGAADADSLGRKILQTYFTQLFFAQEAILDMRSKAFTSLDGALLWQPIALCHRWDKEFIAALRSMYRGFYFKNDEEFRAGLDALGLLSAESMFREHFGTGDQSQVEFSLAHFRQSFHGIFVHCRDQRVRLHPDFMPLGILLGSLYESMTEIGGRHNVREAFETIVKK